MHISLIKLKQKCLYHFIWYIAYNFFQIFKKLWSRIKNNVESFREINSPLFPELNPRRRIIGYAENNWIWNLSDRSLPTRSHINKARQLKWSMKFNCILLLFQIEFYLTRLVDVAKKILWRLLSYFANHWIEVLCIAWWNPGNHKLKKYIDMNERPYLEEWLF